MAGPEDIIAALSKLKGKTFQPTERRMDELVKGFGGGSQPRAPKKPLPMDEASRMQRATEQGYVHDVYHGTAKDFTEFADPIREGGYATGDFGIHVSSDPLAANKRSGMIEGDATDAIQGPMYHEKGAKVLPLKAQMNKTLTLPDMGIWKSPANYVRKYEDALHSSMGGYGDGRGDYGMPEHFQVSDPEFFGEIAKAAKDMYRKQGVGDPQIMTMWQHKLREMMQERGYDSIKYANNVESDGAPSFLLMDPRQVRSKFATFDPARAGSRDLLASLAASLGLGGAAAYGMSGEAPTEEQLAARDANATAAQAQEPGWKTFGRNAIDAVTDFVNPFSEADENSSPGSKLGVLAAALPSIAGLRRMK